MTGTVSNSAQRARELRRDFDQSFAAAPASANAGKENLIAIRMGAHRLALRLSEIGGLYAEKKITRVPGASATMLGIAGFRGSIAPVYDFASLLGHGRGTSHRWLVAAAAAPIALAFEAFDGQLRVSREAIRQQQSHAGAHSFAQDFVEAADILRPIISLKLVLDSIKT